MRGCIYSFGVVWGEARDGIRGKYGEGLRAGRCVRWEGDDLSVEN